MDNRENNFIWWEEEKSMAHNKIFDHVNYLYTNQGDRHQRNLRSMTLYGSHFQSGLSPYTYSKLKTPSMPENRVKMNICSSMVDTVTAKIAKMKPMVTYLTEGGTFSQQQQAKNLQKWVSGQFYSNDVYTKHQLMVIMRLEILLKDLL